MVKKCNIVSLEMFTGLNFAIIVYGAWSLEIFAGLNFAIIVLWSMESRNIRWFKFCNYCIVEYGV